MPKVFGDSWFRKVNVFQSEYPDAGLNAALQSVFDSATLGDAKKPVFVTAANIGQKTLKVFSSLNFEDQPWPCWEVARAATAAETYFSPWKGFADGGIYANNPSMVALAGAARMLKVKLEDIEILSIGTGRSTDEGNPPRGRLTTALWVLKAMLSGSANDMHEYFVKSLPVGKFVRIQFVRDPKWKMDNPPDMYRAERKWASDIAEAVKAVKAF
jgi:patatin-like phospholipase/acyl hydrolase